MDPPPSAWRRRLPIIGAAGVVVMVAALVIASGGIRLPIASDTPPPSPSPSARAAVTPTPMPSSPTAEPVPSTTSIAVTVTFRLALSGPVPDDAVFAIQNGVVGEAQHAIYLCSYDGGYSVCESGFTYEDVWPDLVPMGTRLTYRFWRELDVSGASEEIEAGELTVGSADQVVAVEYAFPP